MFEGIVIFQSVLLGEVVASILITYVMMKIWGRARTPISLLDRIKQLILGLGIVLLLGFVWYLIIVGLILNPICILIAIIGFPVLAMLGALFLHGHALIVGAVKGDRVDF